MMRMLHIWLIVKRILRDSCLLYNFQIVDSELTQKIDLSLLSTITFLSCWFLTEKRSILIVKWEALIIIIIANTTLMLQAMQANYIYKLF